MSVSRIAAPAVPRWSAAVPKRLRPTAPIAADALLVGDPGRALMLAQELLGEPRMSNHARGLWGYTGLTPAGRELTIQATGMGGPSASIVLVDLAELGLRRAVRVGTCVAVDSAHGTGALLEISEAWAAADAIRPDPELSRRLRGELGPGAARAAIASVDHLPLGPATLPSAVGAADLQTATVLARAHALGIAAAAVLIVEEAAGGERITDIELERAAKSAGRAARTVLSS